ncbi:MAG: c-type cytochrome [Gammaproteobacteria bacterium]|nr:MAG: c-type cytochrome [Gammaproteobacteria bacterium]
MRYFSHRWLYCLLLVLFTSKSIAQSTDLHQLVQLAEYIGADYSAAVSEGTIIDAGEYEEMSNFAGILVAQTAALPPEDVATALNKQSITLAQAVENKADLQDIKRLTSGLRSALLAAAPAKVLPAKWLGADIVQPLYKEHCALCHGEQGKGDGAQAKFLTPPPIDFTDKERALNRSIAGLFAAIQEGLDGTAMPSFKQLTLEQQWSLAAYVGSLAFENRNEPPEEQRAVAKALTARDWIMFSPNELATSHSNLDMEVFEQGRADLVDVLNKPQDPLAIARQKLTLVQEAYAQGDNDAAHALAVSAYLDGFELVESTLDNHDTQLRKSIEADLLHLRKQITSMSSTTEIQRSITLINSKLDQIDKLLATSSLSSTTLFTTSAIILLREGIEALLVVLALVMVLIRADRRDIVKYVHMGWGLAVILGIITWIIAQYVITISGASREVMEGVGALLAAIILFYVGFWMHGKANAKAWQQFIEKAIHSNLQQGTLWGIVGLSFIAVYREIFETILFYQALASQITASQYPLLWAGIAAGAVTLALLTWIITRYSIRLPLATFFSITTYLLLFLSFVLMGKAVAALQEAALLIRSPFPVPVEIDWLGIHPTWEGLASQLTIVLLSAWMLLKPSRKPDTSQH